MDPTAQNNTNGGLPQIKGTLEKSVAQILLEEGLLTDAQFHQAESDAISKSIPIDRALFDSKIIAENVYFEARSKLIGIPFVSIATLPISPESLNFIPKAVAERFNILPFTYDKEKNTLSVAMADPLDLETLNFVKQKTNADIISFQAIPSEIKSAIQNQ